MKVEYRDKDWLNDQINNKDKTLVEIGKEQGVSGATISHWKKRFGIEFKKEKPYKDKEIMVELYSVKNMSIEKIAKKLKVNKKTIRKWLIIHNIVIISNRSRENSPHWKGGRKKENKYIKILKPDHPRCDYRGYVAEHILVAEEILGRPIKYYERYNSDNEVPHHIDGNGYNNNPENIWIAQNHSKHKKAHNSMYKLIKPLLNIGIIRFNRIKGVYELLE